MGPRVGDVCKRPDGHFAWEADNVRFPVRMPDGRRVIAPHQFGFLKFQKLFRRAVESYRAVVPPLRVVVCHDHTQAVKKYHVRAGGN